jgi:L-lactate dehydrogenase
MLRSSRIGIIGLGRVGTSVAVSVLHSGLAGDLVLHDVRQDLADGEAMDLAHGSAFLPAATVRGGSLDDMLSADAVVIAAGRNGGPSESRLALGRDNAAIVRDIATQFREYRGLVVLVTNPVDVLTRIFAEVSGLPAERVLGTGTMLDTARLRHAVGRTLGVDARSVHAHVLGEHGDSEVVAWSSARVAGLPLREWKAWTPELETQLAEHVRTAAYEIIKRKGATNHAIGVVAAALLRSYLRDENRVLTVSRVHRGACGVYEVAMSLPTIVGARGAHQVLEPQLDAGERAQLARSAEVLRQAHVSLGSG